MIIGMRTRKPIMQIKGTDNYCGFKYKNTFTAYAIGIPLECETDLSWQEFENFLDGKYTGKQIKKFEMTGRF